MQVRKSDYTDRETFCRAKFPRLANALRFLGDVASSDFHDEILHVKIVSDRGRRAAVTLILVSRGEEVPLHRDDRRQADLQWMADKWQVAMT